MKKDELSDHSKEVARGTFWGLAGTFFGKIISFFYTVYVAHAVSQGDVGLFYLALGIAGLFGVWKDLGLPSALTRYVPYYQSRKEFGKIRQLLKNSYVINTLTGIFITALVWAGADFVGTLYQNPGLPNALRLMSFFMLLDNLFKVSGSYLQGLAEIKLVQAIGTAQVLSKLVFTYALFELWGPTLESLTLAFLASTLFGILLSLPVVLQKTRRLPASGHGMSHQEIYKEIVPFGIMLTLLQTFYTLFSSADRVILGYLLPNSNEAVAIYSIATTLGINIMVFPGAVGGIFLPIISRLWAKKDKKSMDDAIGTSQRWSLFLTLPLAAVMMAFSGEMLSSFFGSAYSSGALAMELFIAGLVFNAFALTVSLALAGMRLVGLELRVMVVSGIANMALNFLLIPPFGLEGAALAAAGGSLLWAILMLHYGKQKAGFASPKESYLLVLAGIITFVLLLAAKPIVASAASFIPAWGGAQFGIYFSKFAYLSLLGAVSAIAFAIFGALALALKCLGREDLLMAEQAASRVGIPKSFWKLVEPLLFRGVKKG